MHPLRPEPVCINAEEAQSVQDADTQLSAMANEFELNEETGVKQTINRSPSQESPSSSASENADFEVKDRREDYANTMFPPQADVLDAVVHLQGERPGRIIRTPARYRELQMGNKVGRL